MQLLPLVEMYCKWELEEDCTNLRALMLRFDSESKLQTHELGRSLLCMIRDEDIGLHNLPLRAPLPAHPSPFDLVRERLAEVGLAITNLHAQVHMAIAPPPQLLIYKLMCYVVVNTRLGNLVACILGVQATCNVNIHLALCTLPNYHTVPNRNSHLAI